MEQYGEDPAVIEFKNWLLKVARLKRGQTKRDVTVKEEHLLKFYDGLRDMWEFKVNLRNERKSKLVKSDAEAVKNFDIYGFGASNYSKLSRDASIALINSYFRALRYDETDAETKRATVNHPLPDNVEDPGDETNEYLIHIGSLGQPDFDFEDADEGEFEMVSLKQADMGLLHLLIAILEYIASETVEKHEKMTATALRKGFNEIHDKFVEKFSRWGLKPPADAIKRDSVGNVLPNTDPEDIRQSLEHWIEVLLFVSAWRVMRYGVTVDTKADESGTVAKSDDVYNPEVIKTKRLEDALNTPYVDYRETMEKNLLATVKIVERLNTVVGLAEIKQQAIGFIKSVISHPLLLLAQPSHMMFIGPPGTGKTTVARIIGDAVKTLRILDSDQPVIEVSRGTFVAPYEGQTPIRSRRALLVNGFENVIVMDEAYQLVQSQKDSSGIEALNSIFQFMNEYPEFILIIAGYESQIDESLFSTQPGLARRVPYVFKFSGYSATEMKQMFPVMLRSLQSKKFIGDWANDGGNAFLQWIEFVLNSKNERLAMERLYRALAIINDKTVPESVLGKAEGDRAAEITHAWLVEQGKEIFARDDGRAYVDRLRGDAYLFGNFAGDMRNLIFLCYRTALSTEDSDGSVHAEHVQVAFQMFGGMKEQRLQTQIKSEKNRRSQK